MNEHVGTNGYMIEPWDHLSMTQSPDGSVHDQYVPPELETLAWQVTGHYAMSVSDMTLITAKPDKGGAIWRINTDQGPRSIKVLHRTPHRSLFSIGAQEYLVKQGARVPPLIPTSTGELYVNAGGKSWIVTDWIEPLAPVSKLDLSGVQELCRGLGDFHRLSRGYIPPFGAIKASRLYRWPQHYEKIIKKLHWFEEIAGIYSEHSSAGVLRSVLPQIQKEASDSCTMFRSSAYERMTAKGEPHWGLAHQDYGWSNGQMGPGGVWIIDLDGVAYDIPIRDLRKLITSTMVDNGGWDIAWVRGMLEAYHEGNPIDRETFELLWIDMAFPNEFYKHVKEIVYEPEIFMQTELEPILNLIRTVDANKWEVLNELKTDMSRYPPGDYPASEEAAPFSMPISLPGSAAVSDMFAASADVPANPVADLSANVPTNVPVNVPADVPASDPAPAIDAVAPEPAVAAITEEEILVNYLIQLAEMSLPTVPLNQIAAMSDTEIPTSGQSQEEPGHATPADPDHNAAAPGPFLEHGARIGNSRTAGRRTRRKRRTAAGTRRRRSGAGRARRTGRPRRTDRRIRGSDVRRRRSGARRGSARTRRTTAPSRHGGAGRSGSSAGRTSRRAGRGGAARLKRRTPARNQPSARRTGPVRVAKSAAVNRRTGGSRPGSGRRNADRARPTSLTGGADAGYNRQSQRKAA